MSFYAPHIFYLDESDEGLVKVDAPSGHDPPQYDAQAYFATHGGAVVPGRFVQFYPSKGAYGIYISLKDFQDRVGGNAKAYKADWDFMLKHQNRIACDVWDDRGRLIGAARSDARGLPPRLIVDDRGSVEDRLMAQVTKWQSIARGVVTGASSARLWKPAGPVKPIFELYIAPNKQFLNEEELEQIKNRVFTERKDLSLWLKVTVLSKAAAAEAVSRADIYLLSNNLLGFYSSYMSQRDIRRLVSMQTNQKGDWQRPFVEESTADEFHQAMVAKKEDLFKGVTLPLTRTWLYSGKPREGRVDAKKIMGKQSANTWGSNIWSENPASEPAEWLHRSAYSFGALSNGDYQSSDNLVFGTYEANSNMTRSEAALRLVTRKLGNLVGNVRGVLITRIVNSGKYNVLNADGGKDEQTIPDWVAQKNYSWLCPELEVLGTFTGDHKTKGVVILPFNARFHPWNRYTDLSFEGTMDSRAWEYYSQTQYRYIAPLDAKDDVKMAPPPGSSRLASTLSVSRSLTLSSDSTLSPTPSRIRKSFEFYQTVNKKSTGPAPNPSLSSQPPPATIPHYCRDPIHHAAWLSAQKHAPVHRMGDTVIRNPRFLQPPSRERRAPSDTPGDSRPTTKPPSRSLPSPDDPTAIPPATGFTLVGEINLFGTWGPEVTLKSWHGPPPAGVEVGSETPICQQAEIDNLAVSSFLPFLMGTPLGNAELSNLTVTYQNYLFEPTKPLGWSLTASLFINEQFESLSQILSQVLQIPPDSLTIQVTASLGRHQSWSDSLTVTNFALEGLIFVKDPATKAYKSIRLCNGISLNQIGVRLFGLSTPTFGSAADDRKEITYGFTIFGELGLQIPASQKPLEFDFEITEFRGLAQLDAALKGDIWKNALGLGFDLEEIRFSAAFGISSPLEALDLSIGAYLIADTATASFRGSYSTNGNFTLAATLEDFGCDGVVDLFRKFSGEEVGVPSDDELFVGSASITLSNTTGLSVIVSDVKYGDYVAASGSLHLSSNGVTLKAELANIDFPEFGFKLVDVNLNASFLKVGGAKSSSVELDVVVQLDGVDDLPKIAGTVHVYKEPQDTKLQWTIYGAFDGLGRSTRLGSLVSELNETFLGDVGLNDLALIIASKDEPALSAMNPCKFPIKRGVQMCAVLVKIEQVEQLLRHPSPGLILCAAWSKASGLALDIQFPADGIIHLGRGITTDPIELQISLNPIRLMIDAGVKVPVPKSNTPLDFKLALSVENEEVYASGQMIGLWRDPFGISPSVAIGPNLALEVGIILPQFAATGTPSALGFAGGLSIGEVRGDVAVVINEDPTQELISGKVEHLGIRDLVSFTSEVISITLPTPPDFIDFEKVSLYFSTGVMIGTVLYPQGFSFEANIKIFGAEFKASAEIAQNTLVAKGSVPNLNIGPLSISGMHSTGATVDLEIGSATQKVLVDGAIHLLGSDIALNLQLEILPHPQFSFDFELHLTPLLTFIVDARMKGTADLKDLSGLDFHLHAVMEQHILEYIIAQITQTIESARKTADMAIEEAQEEVRLAKEAWQRTIDEAQRKLDENYQRWKAHEKAVYDASDKVIDEYTAEMHRLEGKMDEARQTFNKSMQDAEAKIRAANADRAAKLHAAEADIIKAKTNWDNDILGKERELETAREALHRAFASAEHDIDTAEAKVDSLQHQIDEIKDKIHDYDHAHWYEFWKFAAIPGLYIGLGTLEAAKGIADGILEICKGVLEGSDFITSKAAITTAEAALEAVRTTGDGLLIAAEKTLEGVDTISQAAVDGAETFLKGVQVAGDEAVRLAEKVLDDFVEASKALLKAARDAIDTLVKSTEWLAYQAASLGLDAAKHGTVAFDVAYSALQVAKLTEDGVLMITEEFLQALASIFDITKIEITADLSVFSGNFTFDAIVVGIILGERFEVELTLDMTSPATFIHGIYSHVVGRAPKNIPPPPFSPPFPPPPIFPDIQTDFLRDPELHLYIPPNEIYFRVMGYASKMAIFSRFPFPQVGIWFPPYDDQFFTLIFGTGNRQGMYAIKSKETGYVLVSRSGTLPAVDHAIEEGGLDDNLHSWFELKLGAGQFDQYFQLITPSNNLALFSHINSSVVAEIGNAPPDPLQAKQHFYLTWENLIFEWVDFDLDRGRILSSTPYILSQEVVRNGSNEVRVVTIDFKAQMPQTSLFEYKRGLPLTLGYTFKAALPALHENGFVMNAMTDQEWKFGQTVQYNVTHIASFSADMRPITSARAFWGGFKGEVAVPYTMHLRSATSGVSVETTGIWRGSLIWGVHIY